MLEASLLLIKLALQFDGAGVDITGALVQPHVAELVLEQDLLGGLLAVAAQDLQEDLVALLGVVVLVPEKPEQALDRVDPLVVPEVLDAPLPDSDAALVADQHHQLAFLEDVGWQ